MGLLGIVWISGFGVLGLEVDQEVGVPRVLLLKVFRGAGAPVPSMSYMLVYHKVYYLLYVL